VVRSPLGPLFTNRWVASALKAQQAYRDWRYHPTIEHLYCFIQEDGLDVQEIQVMGYHLHCHIRLLQL